MLWKLKHEYPLLNKQIVCKHTNKFVQMYTHLSPKRKILYSYSLPLECGKTAYSTNFRIYPFAFHERDEVIWVRTSNANNDKTLGKLFLQCKVAVAYSYFQWTKQDVTHWNPSCQAHCCSKNILRSLETCQHDVLENFSI